jgi:peptidoglycan/LPS O-acetylase OafA/YrhL
MRGRDAVEHIAVLDTYRAMAATAVVATHAAFQTGVTLHGPFGGLLARLDVGVAIFFALSGFLLYQPWAIAAERDSMEPRTSGYLWRRAVRILPAYWVVVVVALVAVPENQAAPMRVWVAQLTLTQSYVPGSAATALTQMWSLCAEAAFYLLLPVLARLTGTLARRRVRPLRVVSLLSATLMATNVGWVLWANSEPARAMPRVWLPAYLSWFAVGMLLAGVSARAKTERGLPQWASWLVHMAAAPGACLTSAVATLVISSTPIAGPRAFEATATPAQALTKNLLYTLVAFAVMLPGTLGPPRHAVHRFLTTRPLLKFGEISYGVFLWHLLVMYVVFHIVDLAYFTGGFVAVFLLTLVLSIGVADLSWTLIERPVMRRLRSVVS